MTRLLDLKGGLEVMAPEGVPVTVQVPPGSYRLRVAGHGFGEGEPTSWALRLWPREADGPRSCTACGDRHRRARAFGSRRHHMAETVGAATLAKAG
jgi:hypothetical protein